MSREQPARNEKFHYREAVRFALTRNEHQVTLTILHGDERAGFCRIDKKREGLYYISALAIEKKFQSVTREGVTHSPYTKMGSHLLEGVNNFLTSENAVGFLNNTIDIEQKYTMYERHGWITLFGNVMYFDGTKEENGREKVQSFIGPLSV